MARNYGKMTGLLNTIQKLASTTFYPLMH